MKVVRLKEVDLRPASDMLHKVGWFIPAFKGVAMIETIARGIEMSGGAYTQDQLERDLSIVYKAEGLAAMVLHKYPHVPVVQDYKRTIAESVEAHFLGLDHVAVAGLIPVLEGIARQLATKRGITCKGVKSTFSSLTAAYKAFVIEKRIGATDEICVMLDSFAGYVADFVYEDSALYSLADGTNRHGITHGAYSDKDYGRPINFFKTISAVDFLTLMSSFDTNKMSGFAESSTEESRALAERYKRLVALQSEARTHAGTRYSMMELMEHLAKRAGIGVT